MAATAPLAAAVPATMKNMSSCVICPREAWTEESMRAAAQTSTAPMRKWIRVMSTWGQARVRMVQYGDRDRVGLNLEGMIVLDVSSQCNHFWTVAKVRQNPPFYCAGPAPGVESC